MIDRIAARLAPLLAAGQPAVVVTIAEATGSTPRDAGTMMIVTAGELIGTIGGGRLECTAILAARALLAEGGTVRRLPVPLGPRVGQCCGGHVLLDLERADGDVLARMAAWEQQQAELAPVVGLFGAGHVGRALAAALLPLPLRLCWFDPLGEAGAAGLPPAPPPAQVTAAPLADLAALPGGAAAVIMTHDHPLDFALTAAALRRGDLAYVGMIGSATKRARFERRYRAHAGPAELLTRLVCPIGSALVRDKRPPVIAALVTAEVLLALAA